MYQRKVLVIVLCSVTGALALLGGVCAVKHVMQYVRRERQVVLEAIAMQELLCAFVSDHARMPRNLGELETSGYLVRTPTGYLRPAPSVPCLSVCFFFIDRFTFRFHGGPPDIPLMSVSGHKDLSRSSSALIQEMLTRASQATTKGFGPAG